MIYLCSHSLSPLTHHLVPSLSLPPSPALPSRLLSSMECENKIQKRPSVVITTDNPSNHLFTPPQPLSPQAGTHPHPPATPRCPLPPHSLILQAASSCGDVRAAPRLAPARRAGGPHDTVGHITLFECSTVN